MTLHLLLLLTFILIVLGTLQIVIPVLATRLIKSRLGGYRRVVPQGGSDYPERLTIERSVAVLGGGVAGISAALTLARRGYAVTLIEKNSYLGGKLGSWPVELEPGRTVSVSHGFHAFFPCYYNFNRLLDSLGLRQDMVGIGDYVILGRDGSVQRFAKLSRTPGLNLLSMWRAGAFTLKDAIAAPGRDCYGIFLEYDAETTFERYDSMSFATFAERAQVPPRLKKAFNTFARAFFADESRLSLAELIKSFHFYFLSQDGGLLYEFPTDDYEPALLAPLRKEFSRLGVDLRLGNGATQLVRKGDDFSIDGSDYDAVVLATDVVGAHAIMTQASGLEPTTADAFTELQPGQRYAVLRIWIDRPIRDDIPIFVITEKLLVLDSVTTLSRFERSAKEDAKAHKCHTLELHCYSVPDELTEEQVRRAFVDELMHFFPELSGMRVIHEHLQLRRDFTAYHVDCGRHRPTVSTKTPGLVCAGDWVKLPFPAMLLEASCSSGLLAANELMLRDGVRPEPIHSVPLRGLMADMPEPKARLKWLGRNR